MSSGNAQDAYRDTVFLPRTNFPMRAGLAKKEPEILKRWEEMDLYRRQREVAAGRPVFVLHDGPPYSNGNIHIGTAGNKILKDVINRAYHMLGYDVRYVPGWDCHGLPIEWKIEERHRAQGRDKDDIPILDLRRECREFADYWIGVQKEEFKRLGVLGDWDNPYTTMTAPAEARIAAEIHKFALDGSLYKGARPVLWSVEEKTALADAEVEYHDKTSTTVWVRFPVVRPGHPAVERASLVIWTTTPWTIPGNRALGVGPEITYAVAKVSEVAEGSRAKVGERLVVARDLLDTVCQTAGITGYSLEATLTGQDLDGTRCRHPWAGFDRGFDFEVPVLQADFVATDQGTGVVHLAPGHGEEDFELAHRSYHIPIPDTVGPDGFFNDEVGIVAGLHVFKADEPVCKALDESQGLLARGKYTHAYPHSWRSKAPLIFRNTPQWFISMSATGLRDKALGAIDETRFIPESGRNRLRSMVEQRPDWCISRQRAWGVPIAVFVEKATDRLLRDRGVYERVHRIFAEEGSDAWWQRRKSDFLGEGYDPDAFEAVTDIVDVWFESGSTHSFVLEDRDDLEWPAELYLEGSDQHRGWFQSSLLESCGTRGRAPYNTILTHGFVLDPHGRKMSKSLGNVIAPQSIWDTRGADILRLWTVSADYTEDMRIGEDILGHMADMYRRVRNTLRFALGNLADFDPATEKVAAEDMPELERWVLHRLAEMDQTVRDGCARFDFHNQFFALHHFCATDLSAFYFDVRKDALYCDRPDSLRRRAARTVLDHLLACLIPWLAPITCFTAEEAWGHYTGRSDDSIHLHTYPQIPSGWRDEALGQRWEAVRDIRRVVTGALELARADKTIGASMQAAPAVYLTEERRRELGDVDLAEIAITSGIELITGDVPPAEEDLAFRLEDVDGVAVVMQLADGQKCQRCWQVLPSVGQDSQHPELCQRCVDAVTAQQAAAE